MQLGGVKSTFDSFQDRDVFNINLTCKLKNGIFPEHYGEDATRLYYSINVMALKYNNKLHTLCVKLMENNVQLKKIRPGLYPALT